MLIDNKGRLFGKVNIIDLCVVIAIIGVGAFLGMKFMSPSAEVKPVSEDYIIKFYVEEVPDYVANVIQLGDRVEDEQKSIFLGTVSNIVTGPGYEYTPNAAGELPRGYKEGYVSCEITAELKAQAFANGLLIEGNKYGVGHTFVIRAGKAKIYLKLSAIEPKGA